MRQRRRWQLRHRDSCRRSSAGQATETRRAHDFLRKLGFLIQWLETLESDLPTQEHRHTNSERTNYSSELPIQSIPTLQVGYELSEGLLTWGIDRVRPSGSNRRKTWLLRRALQTVLLKDRARYQLAVLNCVFAAVISKFLSLIYSDSSIAIRTLTSMFTASFDLHQRSKVH